MTRKCTCCGQTVTWDLLRPLGVKDYGRHGVIEYRNCSCGSTLSRQISGPSPSSAPPESGGDRQFADAE